MGRCSKLDWDDKTANEFFEDTVSVSEKLKKDVSTLWRYSKGLPKQWKHSICWGDAKQHRFALAEAFTKTKGRQLNHKKLSEQLAAWLQDKGVKVTATDTELAAYRLRAMMRHLADFKRDQQKVQKTTQKATAETFEPILKMLILEEEQESDTDEVVSVQPTPTEAPPLVWIDDSPPKASPLKETWDDGMLDELEASLFPSSSLVATAATAVPTSTALVAADPTSPVAAVPITCGKRLRKKTIDPLKERTPGHESNLKELLDLSNRGRAPSPKEFLELTKLKKVMKGAKKKKTKPKKQLKATKAMKVMSSSTAPPPQKYIDTAETYAPEKHPGVEMKVLQNRLHCNVWKKEKALQMQHVSERQASTIATLVTKKVMQLWKAKFG